MPSLLGPTNLPPLEALLRGCSVAVTQSARANLGDWPGVIELNGNDIPAWSNLLDVTSGFPQVDIPKIQAHLAQIEASNVVKLKSLFMNFKFMKSTYSS